MKNVKENPEMPNESRYFRLTSYDLLCALSVSQRIAIDAFVSEVERRAEEKMLLTGKLEGAHYAALKQIQREIQGSA